MVQCKYYESNFRSPAIVIMKASELFVASLEKDGVECVFGIPGEENLDLLEALSKSKIRLILTRHEQAAGFMAATYGRLTGKAGVCLATLGPGATNLVTAAAYAQLGGMPMLMITGQEPVKSSKQGQFQIIDVVDMMQPLTKYTRQIASGGNIPSQVREAIRTAEEERPGATHLELPEDVAQEEVQGAPLQESAVRRPGADVKSIHQAIQRIERSCHPLIVIGAAANRKLTSKMLRRFITNTGIPFVSTQMGKGVVDECDPRFLGNAALSDGDFVHRAIDHADLIINVGHDVIEKPPFFMREGGVEVIHINYSSAKVDPVYFPQLEVVGDIANAIWRIDEGLSRQACWDFSFFSKVRDALQAQQQQGTGDARFPIFPSRLVEEVRSAMPDDGIIALDNGIYKIWFARNFPARLSNTVLLDNALASMGAGLPSGIAASLVYPDRKIMAICGDGGFMMNSQELETAVRLKLSLVVLVLRDDAYGMIKWKQQHMGFADFGLDFVNPDFVKYAESYGAVGHRLSSVDELVPLVNRCFELSGIHVIDVPVDYSENDRILHREIKELSKSL